MIDLGAIRDDMLALALEAGSVVMEIYEGDYRVETKGDGSPVTTADKRANEILTQGVMGKYPGVPVLAEETEDNACRMCSDYCFIIDPIDGTKEFILHNGEFSINIGLVHKGKVVAGVVYAPVLGRIWHAVKDQGAYVQEVGGVAERIQVSDRRDDLIAYRSRSHHTAVVESLYEDFSPVIARVEELGSTIKACRIAEGLGDVYYCGHGLSSQWDTAAIQIIVEEAGGILEQMDGSAFVYNRDELRNELGYYVVNSRANVWI